jgi:hypothetical protein
LNRADPDRPVPTRPVEDPVAATDDDASTTVLGDWFATALFWKPQVALLVNHRTLLPVFRPLHHGHADLDCDFGPPVKHARRAKLGNIADVGDSFTYSYDFGDGWEHTITIENVIPTAPGMTVPACTDGRRACPPEDCGGPWGYGELLAILADPSHAEHEERVMWAGEWGGGRLDPEAFDTSEFADNLDLLRNASLD